MPPFHIPCMLVVNDKSIIINNILTLDQSILDVSSNILLETKVGMYIAYKVVLLLSFGIFFIPVMKYSCGVHVVRYLKFIQLQLTLKLLLCIIFSSLELL